MSEREKMWHNQGQSDASEGHCRHSPGAFADEAAQRAYKEGWAHARGQQDAEKGEYHSPHFFRDDTDPENRAYKSGWEGSYDNDGNSDK